MMIIQNDNNQLKSLTTPITTMVEVTFKDLPGFGSLPPAAQLTKIRIRDRP